MDNSLNSVNLNKAPSPNFVDTTATKTVTAKRKLNMPNVGVVDAPKMSSLPLHDSIVKNKNENPKTAYKISFPKEKIKGLKKDFILSLTILACSIVSIFSLKKSLKIKKLP